jgi:hypothetical protein
MKAAAISLVVLFCMQIYGVSVTLCSQIWVPPLEIEIQWICRRAWELAYFPGPGGITHIYSISWACIGWFPGHHRPLLLTPFLIVTGSEEVCHHKFGSCTTIPRVNATCDQSTEWDIEYPTSRRPRKTLASMGPNCVLVNATSIIAGGIEQ